MGRQNMDQAVAGSSIVLLQERFKQLQRLKEMREERQLRKISADNYEEPIKMSTFQDPLALGLNSNSHYTEHFGAITPQKSPPSVSARGHHGFFQKPDVDTSLRL